MAEDELKTKIDEANGLNIPTLTFRKSGSNLGNVTIVSDDAESHPYLIALVGFLKSKGVNVQPPADIKYVAYIPNNEFLSRWDLIEQFASVAAHFPTPDTLNMQKHEHSRRQLAEALSKYQVPGLKFKLNEEEPSDIIITADSNNILISFMNAIGEASGLHEEDHSQTSLSIDYRKLKSKAEEIRTLSFTPEAQIRSLKVRERYKLSFMFNSMGFPDINFRPSVTNDGKITIEGINGNHGYKPYEFFIGRLAGKVAEFSEKYLVHDHKISFPPEELINQIGLLKEVATEMQQKFGPQSALEERTRIGKVRGD